MTTSSQRVARSGRCRPLITAGWVAALALTLAIAPAGAGHASEPSGGAVSLERPGAVGDEILVRFRPGTSRRERGAARRRAGTPIRAKLPLDGLQQVDAPHPSALTRTIAELEHSPEVLYAEADERRTATGPIPDDDLFGRQWGLENRGARLEGERGIADADVDARAAWRMTTGSGRVKVAVIDTGIAATHPELAPNLWTNAGEAGVERRSNGRDDDGNGQSDDLHGWDFVADDRRPDDDHGHGTHVAGTVAARGGNGRGVAGVAWHAAIMPLKVLDDDGKGKVSDGIRAYRYAAAEGARIVNLSLGGDPFSRAERDALAAAPRTLFVIAAGNHGSDNDEPGEGYYPCSYPLANVVCVAASTSRDRLADFSNHGRSSVDLAAPGSRILSTLPGADYDSWSGTSMAAPHVSGAAALIMAAHPRLSVAQVKAALLFGADQRAPFAGRTVTGGRLNVRHALELAARLR